MKRNNPSRNARPSKKQNTTTMSKARGGLTTARGVYFWRESHPQLGYLSQWYWFPMRDSQDQSKVYYTAEQYVLPYRIAPLPLTALTKPAT